MVGLGNTRVSIDYAQKSPWTLVRMNQSWSFFTLGLWRQLWLHEMLCLVSMVFYVTMITFSSDIFLWTSLQVLLSPTHFEFIQMSIIGTKFWYMMHPKICAMKNLLWMIESWLKSHSVSDNNWNIGYRTCPNSFPRFTWHYIRGL